MSVHNWQKVYAGLFHHFHQSWTMRICDALNQGIMPKGYYALVESHALGVVPDVLTLNRRESDDVDSGPPMAKGGIAILDAPPQAAIISEVEEEAIYVEKANRIKIHRSGGDLVSVIELVSPGNKSSKASITSFVEKSQQLIQSGVHLFVIDLFPPTRRDPHGLHPLIWDYFREEPFDLPRDKPLCVMSYFAALMKKAYVEPLAIGGALPKMPLFLSQTHYVHLPLEETYAAAFAACPSVVKEGVS
jgi:Protein of unknown function (DUF4058)